MQTACGVDSVKPQRIVALRQREQKPSPSARLSLTGEYLVHPVRGVLRCRQADDIHSIRRRKFLCVAGGSRDETSRSISFCVGKVLRS